MSRPFNEMITDKSEDGEKLRRQVSEALDQNERNSFEYLWDYTARKNQLPPEGDWRIWMIMAGRGFGKTRSGAEWVRMIADANPHARIALVSSSLAEARAVMVEGESGLLAICRPGHKPLFEPSLHRIRFRSGAQAQLFSAAEPESLRGPQHSHACRSGAEGVLRQSGTRPAGLPPRPGYHRVSPGTACRCRRGRSLSGDRHGHGRLGGPRRQHCHPDRRWLALHSAGRGHAPVRSRSRPDDHVPVTMGGRDSPCHALLRGSRGRRGTGRAGGADSGPDGNRDTRTRCALMVKKWRKHAHFVQVFSDAPL